MRSILYNKRGELTTKQIVVMIILIISFVIILFFIFQLSPIETADKQICHDSVVLRGNSLIGGQTLPLNCKTNFVYVTASSTKSNKRMSTPQRVVDVRTKEDVYEFLANDMYDCWWMYGEGKVDYLGEVDWTSNSYCSICSQIVFDESVKKIFADNGGKLSKDDFYKTYLTKNIPGKQTTYSEYLLGTKNPDDYLTQYNIETSSGEQTVGATSWGNTDLDKTQILIMSIKSEVSTTAWVLTGAAVVGAITAGVLLTPFTLGASLVSAVGAVIVIGGATAGGVAGGVLVAPMIKGSSGRAFNPPSLMEFKSKNYKSLKCIEIKSLS